MWYRPCPAPPCLPRYAPPCPACPALPCPALPRPAPPPLTGIVHQVLFGHREMMDAMRQSRKMDIASWCSWCWNIVLLVPHSVAIVLAFPDVIRTQGMIHVIMHGMPRPAFLAVLCNHVFGCTAQLNS